MAPRRRGEAARAARQWAHRSETQVLPRPEVHPQAAAYRQLVEVCRGRRAADPYAVMERLPEVHPQAAQCRRQAGACPELRDVQAEAASPCRQPGAWSLPHLLAVVQAEWPAVPAWVLRAQRPALVCQRRVAGLFGPERSASQPLAAWRASALPSEPALPDVPGTVRRRAASWVSGPCAAAGLLTEAEEAVCPDAQVRPPGVAAVAEPLAQQQGAAEAEEVPLAQQREEAAASRASAEVRPREAALQVAAAEQRQAAVVLQASVAAVRRRVGAEVLPVAQAAVRLRAADPSRAALPSPVAASTCLQALRWDRPAPAQSARSAPARARLRTALP